MLSYFTSLAIRGVLSSIAEYRNVRKLQDKSSTRFANDRSYNVHQLLFYTMDSDAFWTVNEDSVDPMFSSNKRQFETCVDDFANAMSRYCPDERTRKDEALSRLNDIFECYLESRIHPLMAANVYKESRMAPPTGMLSDQ
ncbi:hypothetical protein BJV78DRAFT_227794 [Lactifluus subvellereus]|nr:hypothetical protein BJV78DRAFT_227794 [Lactifluus subvellereus]